MNSRMSFFTCTYATPLNALSVAMERRRSWLFSSLQVGRWCHGWRLNNIYLALEDKERLVVHQGKVISDLFSSPISLAVVREFSRMYTYAPTRTYLHTNPVSLLSLKEGSPSYYTVRFRVLRLNKIWRGSLSRVKWFRKQDCPRPTDVGGEVKGVLIVVEMAIQASNIE